MAEGADTVRAPADAEEMEKGEPAGAAAGADGDSAAPQPVDPTWAFWIGNPQEEPAGRGNAVHTFSTVDDFLSLYKNVLQPSKLGVGADLHCFKNKIEPKCEGPIFADGGAWTISCGQGKSQQLWLDTLLALIGEQFEYDDEICGAVLSTRGRQETIAIWIKDATNEVAQGIEEDLIKCLAPTYRGEFSLPGALLRSKGLNWIGNLLVPNDNYCKFQNLIMPLFDQMLQEQSTELLAGCYTCWVALHFIPSRICFTLGCFFWVEIRNFQELFVQRLKLQSVDSLKSTIAISLWSAQH